MKLKMRKFTAIVLAIFMLVGTSIVSVGATASVPTTFLALGDSISTGYGLEGYTVTNTLPYAPGSFVELLKSEKGFATTNLAFDGMTSSVLAEKTNPQDMPAQLKPIFQTSNIISVTIGGNDLLGAFYTAMATAMGKTIGTDITIAEVQTAIIAGATGSNPQMSICLAMAVKTVTTALPSIVENFGNQLSQIITNLKSLNPTSTVIVQTIANPYKSIPGADALVSALDAAVTAFNTVIAGGAQTGAYKVIDVYTAFKNSSEILTNATNPLMPLDPHPNAAGHKVIANLVFTAVHTHTESEWIVDKAPSFTEEGTRHTMCTVCEQTIKTETIAKLPSNQNIVDSATGIKVEYADGAPMDASITLALASKSKTEMNSFKGSIDKVSKGSTLAGLYDMKLMKDGAEIQPNGKVKISIPLTDQMKNMSDVKIVWIDDNGVSTIVPSEIIDGKIVFTSDYLSCYGVIGTSKSNNPNSTKPNTDSPKTGSTSPLFPIVILAIVSGGAFLTIGRKKLQRK